MPQVPVWWIKGASRSVGLTIGYIFLTAQITYLLTYLQYGILFSLHGMATLLACATKYRKFIFRASPKAPSHCEDP